MAAVLLYTVLYALACAVYANATAPSMYRGSDPTARGAGARGGHVGVPGGALGKLRGPPKGEQAKGSFPAGHLF